MQARESRGRCAPVGPEWMMRRRPVLYCSSIALVWWQPTSADGPGRQGRGLGGSTACRGAWTRMPLPSGPPACTAPCPRRWPTPLLGALLGACRWREGRRQNLQVARQELAALLHALNLRVHPRPGAVRSPAVGQHVRGAMALAGRRASARGHKRGCASSPEGGIAAPAHAACGQNQEVRRARPGLTCTQHRHRSTGCPGGASRDST